MTKPETTIGLKKLMDILSPAGWEIRLSGPRRFEVTTPGELPDWAQDRIAELFWPDSKILFAVGDPHA